MQSQKIVLRGPHLPSNLWVSKRPCWPWSSRAVEETAASRSGINHQQAQLMQLYYNLIDTPIKVYSIVTFSTMLWVTQHAKKKQTLSSFMGIPSSLSLFAFSIFSGTSPWQKCMPN